MVTGILGKKIGMTQIFDENGKRIPVTVLEAGPCVVQDIKTIERDGYSAVQIGFDDKKEKNVNKPQREYLKAKGLKAKRYVKEIRCDELPEDMKIGSEIDSSMFQKGDYLDVVGVSKGKGFQGGMKRCGWAGGRETHGSMSHRVPGSIGASSYPSRVFKGHPFPGQTGNEKVTVQNLKVIEIDAENDTIIVQGAVPGANGSYLLIRFAKKKPIAPREVKEEPQEAEEPAVEQEEAQAEAAPQEAAPAEEAPEEEKAPEAAESEDPEKKEEVSGEEATKEGNEE